MPVYIQKRTYCFLIAFLFLLSLLLIILKPSLPDSTIFQNHRTVNLFPFFDFMIKALTRFLISDFTGYFLPNFLFKYETDSTPL